MKFALAALLLATSTVFAQVSPEAASSPIGNTYSCVVKKVWDGDTFDALCNKIGESRIRFYQIDAPENSQPGGAQSRAFLKSMILDKTVRVRIVDVSPALENKKARLVGIVRLDNKSLAAVMVKAGHAWYSPGYVKPGNTLIAFQATAKKTKVGLWASPDPIPPWAWRHGKRPKQP